MSVFIASSLFAIVVLTPPAECTGAKAFSRENVSLVASSDKSEAKQVLPHVTMYLAMAKVTVGGDEKSPIKIHVSAEESDGVVDVTLALHDGATVVRSAGGRARYGRIAQQVPSHQFWTFPRKEDAFRHAAYEAARALLCTP